MRVFIQRVSEASVTIAGNVAGNIAQGYCILLGIEDADNQEDIAWLCSKIIGLRIFSDEEGKMNKSIIEVGGEILVISQFTLHAATKKGNRPSFIKAAKPEIAIPLYETFIQRLTLQLGKAIATGHFGADMKVALVNDGPVSIWIDSKNKE
jgi:D-aminoacyl-tRNA deacylase